VTRREQLYPEIRRLREDEGLKWREIGERLGIPLKTAATTTTIRPARSQKRARRS
jgi:DNA-directed RNA polymerase specialized sigma24 family protein